MLWTVLILLLLILLYLFLLMPRMVHRADMSAFKGRLIAHRGMFDREENPENSMAAFRKAVEHGFGIELDIHRTADGQVVVFHDDDLKRMCGADKAIEACTFDELRQLSLGQSDEKIPLFSDVLQLIGGRVPLIVELKGVSLKDNGLCAAAADMLGKYQGPFCVESFNPILLRRWRKLRPGDARGVLATDFMRADEGASRKFAIFNSFIQMALARPDFVAFDERWDRLFTYRLVAKLFRPVLVAWTVREQAALDRCRKCYDLWIAENLDRIG